MEKWCSYYIFSAAFSCFLLITVRNYTHQSNIDEMLWRGNIENIPNHVCVVSLEMVFLSAKKESINTINAGNENTINGHIEKALSAWTIFLIKNQFLLDKIYKQSKEKLVFESFYDVCLVLSFRLKRSVYSNLCHQTSVCIKQNPPMCTRQQRGVIFFS